MDKGQALLDILEEIKQEKETGMANKPQEKPPLIRETNTGREKYCPACKDYHPATEAYFYKDSNSTTKLTSWCRKATRAKQQKQNQKTKSKPATKRKSGFVLQLDFTGHKALLEALNAKAENELREPEMQVLWLIKTALCNGGNAGGLRDGN